MCCFLSRRRNTPMPMLVKNIGNYTTKLEIVTRRNAKRRDGGEDGGAVDERAYA
jgi:hypothetical protein